MSRLRSASWAFARSAAADLSHHKFAPAPPFLQPLLLPLLERGFDFKTQIMPSLTLAARETHALLCDAMNSFQVRNPSGYFVTRFRASMAGRTADREESIARHRIIPLDARLPKDEYLALKRRIRASLSASEDAPSADLD